MPTQQPIAPVYRYFTADLLTDEILAEIPLRGVSFECALKAAGQFSGRIPITAETDSMSLYNSTMPGQTALYVVRNGVCVWGGIIWSRGYELTSKDLSISASEFTSYFYHRKIWKTWNHQYGGTVYWDDPSETWKVSLDLGSTVVAVPGSTVRLDFYEPSNFQFNGNYRVSPVPKPTTDGFSLASGSAVVDIIAGEERGINTYLYTRENHGYAPGDVITVSLSGKAPHTVALTSENIPEPNLIKLRTADYSLPVSVGIEGSASKPLPRGTYSDVSITVRMDTYDYIRSLIDSVFEDFVGSDFPNEYIEPGISKAVDIKEKSISDGVVHITTEEPNGISPGQAVQIHDVGVAFDGEHEVLSASKDLDGNGYTFTYAGGGDMPPTSVSILEGVITSIQMSAGLATVSTSSPHGFVRGNNVSVVLGDAFSEFNGVWSILDTPTPTSFRFQALSTNNLETTLLPNARVFGGGHSVGVVAAESHDGIVTLTLAEDVPFIPSDTVTVENVNRVLQIGEKSLDAPNGVATVQTLKPHGLRVGDSVSLSGLSDVSEVVSKRSTTTHTTYTTARPHNFRVSDTVEISGLEGHVITKKQLSSGTATLTTDKPHNISVGNTFTVSDLWDETAISNVSITAGVARVETAANNIEANSSISIVGLEDKYRAVSKEVTDGLVMLTLSAPHNLLVGDKIVVEGLGVPFDGTNIEVQDITTTRVMYQIDSNYWDAQSAQSGHPLDIPTTVPTTKASGVVTALDSFYNGNFIVTGRGTNFVEFWIGGHDQVRTAAEGTSPVIVSSSVMNGTFTASSRTQFTVSYVRSGNNSPVATILPPENEEDIIPMITRESIHAGNRTITSVGPNTFTFAQALTWPVTQPVAGYARRSSIFNGTRTVVSTPTPDRFTFNLPGRSASIVEHVEENLAFASVSSVFNVAGVTVMSGGVDLVSRTISYEKSVPDYGTENIASRGAASVRPSVVVSTFGPYPGNANIGMKFDSRGFTGVNIPPTPYRGFELTSVGDALDSYSDNINGFEYRIDCAFIKEENRFTKTFVLIPINFPDPPGEGEVSPLSRFGADKLVFEFPGGNITNVSIEESAEESATRFFAVGETDLGPEAGPNMGVATASELLNGNRGRRWPLLDATETVAGTEDKSVLYSNAERYLSESAPPYTTMSVSLNGSIAPFVGDYRPGDWCSLILNDPFMQMRLGNDLEPRSDVIVRKIDSFSVSVPDGVTFPETVSLNLIAEWEVDKRG